ncbi:MAG: thiolase [Alphaproteobacteria bacterium]|nr:thiolase [Alphaproteobacteria bacterium]MCB9929042.1 thiolase [Alphaproteobacteria bacterium]
MKPGSVAVVGAAETTELGKLPHMSNIQLHADAALNAMADCGLKPEDIDGIATARENPIEIAHYLGIKPRYVDGTSVGGCSFMIHVKHAVAAIESGMADTILVTHGESGRSQVGMTPRGINPAMLDGQFQIPYGVTNPPTMFTIPVLRYLKTYNVPIERVANVAVVQREWSAMHPRATFRDPLTVDDVMNARMIAWPFSLLMCCLVTDGGGALILTRSDRAKDFPTKPVYVLGAGEAGEHTLVSQMSDFTSSQAFRIAGENVWKSSGLKHSDVDHLMIYDAFAHLPIYGLEDLGFVGRGEGGDFIWEGNTRPGGKLPLNTNGGGLSYMHSGMYGMYALQESVRQMRGTSPAQVEGAKVSLCHGVGGMFSASGSIMFSNELP